MVVSLCACGGVQSDAWAWRRDQHTRTVLRMSCAAYCTTRRVLRPGAASVPGRAGCAAPWKRQQHAPSGHGEHGRSAGTLPDTSRPAHSLSCAFERCRTTTRSPSVGDRRGTEERHGDAAHA